VDQSKCQNVPTNFFGYFFKAKKINVLSKSHVTSVYFILILLLGILFLTIFQKVQRELQIKIYNARWLFWSQFWPPLKRASFYDAAGAVSKIGSSLKPNFNCNFSLPKSVLQSVQSGNLGMILVNGSSL